ncbi:hypothetical protein [Hyphomicrobium sp.]|uniref:hypothetical protein n=1 Tax=Hyphomicrobium sp. TaxID=82 RepID=UPI002D7FDCB6|nr:hypothetical protein [Hyphomicrobium sp.]
MPLSPTANRMSYGGTLGEKGIGKELSVECAVTLKRGVKAILAFPFFTNDDAGLVVSDFDDV